MYFLSWRLYRKGFRMGHMGNIDKHVLVSAVAAIERAAMRRNGRAGKAWAFQGL